MYELWRRHREREQLERFADLVRRSSGLPGFEPADLRRRLASRAAARRPLGPTPGIAIFGTSDWEQHGLWPALRGAGAHLLFDYRAARASMSGRGPALRAAVGRLFLEQIEAAERAGSRVEVAFLYAAGFHVDPGMLAALRERGIWTVLMALDDKQQLGAPPRDGIADWQLEAARAVDLYWTTWRTAVAWLAHEGANPWYAPTGADPALFHPMPATRDIEVLWVGRGYGPRYRLVRDLRRQGFDVRAYGPGWEGGLVPFDEMLKLYARSEVLLGMGGVGQTDAYKHLKGRDFEVPMTGSLYLTSFNPELTDHFHIGAEILCYSTAAECADVLRWVLARPRVAERIRAAARARCLRDHTWQGRVGELLRLLRAGQGADNEINEGVAT